MTWVFQVVILKKKDNREIINVFVLVELICRILVLKFDYICK